MFGKRRLGILTDSNTSTWSVYGTCVRLRRRRVSRLLTAYGCHTHLHKRDVKLKPFSSLILEQSVYGHGRADSAAIAQGHAGLSAWVGSDEELQRLKAEWEFRSDLRLQHHGSHSTRAHPRSRRIPPRLSRPCKARLPCRAIQRRYET